MKHTLIMTALIASLAMPLFSATAEAGSCRNAINNASQKIFGSALKTACVGVDTGLKENSPFIYVNPDGGCDMGLQLPGLPDFGASFGKGFDMCAMAKTVLGPMVGQVNNRLQEEMNQAVGEINDIARDQIGIEPVGNHIDFDQLLKQKAEEEFRSP